MSAYHIVTTPIQDRIDALRRERLVLDLLGCILANQKTIGDVAELLSAADCESDRIGEAIDELVAYRDATPAQRRGDA